MIPRIVLLFLGGELLQKVQIGDKFGLLEVIRKATREEALALSSANDQNPRCFYLCSCACGKTAPRFYRVDHLRQGRIKSCGCVRRQFAVKLGKESGMRSNTSTGREVMGFENGTNIKHLKNTMAGRLNKKNTTRTTGVWKKGNKFIAEIHFQSRKYYLGIFPSEQIAKSVRAAAEQHVLSLAQSGPKIYNPSELNRELKNIAKAVSSSGF